MSFLPVLGAEMLLASSFRNTRWGRPGRPVPPENGPCGKGLRNYVRIDFYIRSYKNRRQAQHQRAAPRGTRANGDYRRPPTRTHTCSIRY
jgi:hypothetical protein